MAGAVDSSIDLTIWKNFCEMYGDIVYRVLIIEQKGPFKVGTNDYPVYLRALEIGEEILTAYPSMNEETFIETLSKNPKQ